MDRLLAILLIFGLLAIPCVVAAGDYVPGPNVTVTSAPNYDDPLFKFSCCVTGPIMGIAPGFFHKDIEKCSHVKC
jgi:hypothetical protein